MNVSRGPKTWITLLIVLSLGVLDVFLVRFRQANLDKAAAPASSTGAGPAMSSATHFGVQPERPAQVERNAPVAVHGEDGADGRLPPEAASGGAARTVQQVPPSSPDLPKKAQPSATQTAETPGTSERTNLAVPMASGAGEEEEIRTALARWAEAMTRNDPDAEAAQYAQHLGRYFLQTDVTRSFVLADKKAYLRRGNVTANFAIADLQFVQLTPDTAQLRLVKDVTWERSAQGRVRKRIRSALEMVRAADGWKISGERDFR